MPLVEGCKHSLDIEIPVDEVRAETERVLADVQKKAHLPGFRPGKAPVSIIRTRFSQQIRQEVLEQLVPKAFHDRAEKENLRVVGQPSISDLHFHDNEPLKFKAEFEVMPEFELGDFREIPVEYEEPSASEEEVEERINSIRERKAEYVNQDPRPLEDGDFAVISLESTGGVEGEPIKNEDMMMHIGDAETFPEFTESLRGASPGDERDLEITYPEEYPQERIKGRTVKYHVTVKGVRKKELPELNDEFAQDLGDFQNMEELRDAVRKAITAEKQYEAQREAKDKIVEELVNRHEFPVPEAWVDRQIEMDVESRLRSLASQGVDPRKLNLDWAKLKESHKDRAVNAVKASLLLDKIADRESLYATNEEVDREVQRIAKQDREPVAAVRMKLEKDGALGRIANHIRTEKTLNFLFENARKVPKTAAAE